MNDPLDRLMDEMNEPPIDDWPAQQPLRLFLIENTSRHGLGMFTAAVIVARTEEQAQRENPAGAAIWDDAKREWRMRSTGIADRLLNAYWCEPELVKVTAIGAAAEGLTEGQILIKTFRPSQ